MALGGIGDWVQKFQGVDVAFLSPLDMSRGMTVAAIALASALAVGVSLIGVPQLLVRYIAVSGEDDIRKASRETKGNLP